MATPHRTHDSEATREALLDAAAELFADKGFEGCSLREISERSKVNKAMVSYHFGGKEQLYAAVIRREIDGLADALDALAKSHDSAEDRLGRLIDAFSTFLRERPTFPRILLREHLAGGRRLREDVLRDLLRFFRTTERILLDGASSGEFRRIDPHEAHLSLIGSLVYFAASAPFRREVLDPDAEHITLPDAASFARHTRRLFVRGLRAEPEPRPGGRPNAPSPGETA